MPNNQGKRNRSKKTLQTLAKARQPAHGKGHRTMTIRNFPRDNSLRSENWEAGFIYKLG